MSLNSGGFANQKKTMVVLPKKNNGSFAKRKSPKKQ
jgi:hypothetical protein